MYKNKQIYNYLSEHNLINIPLVSSETSFDYFEEMICDKINDFYHCDWWLKDWKEYSKDKAYLVKGQIDYINNILTLNKNNLFIKDIFKSTHSVNSLNDGEVKFLEEIKEFLIFDYEITLNNEGRNNYIIKFKTQSDFTWFSKILSYTY